MVRVYDLEVESPPKPKLRFFIDPLDRVRRAASALLSRSGEGCVFVWPALTWDASLAIDLGRAEDNGMRPVNDPLGGNFVFGSAGQFNFDIVSILGNGNADDAASPSGQVAV